MAKSLWTLRSSSTYQRFAKGLPYPLPLCLRGFASYFPRLRGGQLPTFCRLIRSEEGAQRLITTRVLPPYVFSICYDMFISTRRPNTSMFNPIARAGELQPPLCYVSALRPCSSPTSFRRLPLLDHAQDFSIGGPFRMISHSEMRLSFNGKTFSHLKIKSTESTSTFILKNFRRMVGHKKQNNKPLSRT